MRRPGVTFAVLLFSATLTAQSLPELFHKAKAEVKGESWRSALTTLERLDVESAKPGNEAARRQLEAPMAFYRGVCEANLDMAEKAQADFELFLTQQPKASMDPSMYSKKAISAFRAAQKNAPPPDSADGDDKRPAMFVAFQEFKMPPNASEPVGEMWADGPVQWIMTEEEKRTWQSLAFADERLEFADRFWEARNPKPGNPDNSYRNTFDRRVAFADANFVQVEGTRGSMTDRGMVFVLLGPPTFVGRKPIRTGEDVDVSTGTSLAGSRAAAYAQRTMAATGDSSGALGRRRGGGSLGPGHQGRRLGLELAGNLALPPGAAPKKYPISAGRHRVRHPQELRGLRSAARRRRRRDARRGEGEGEDDGVRGDDGDRKSSLILKGA